MKLNRVSLNVVGLNRIGLNRIGSPSRGSSSGSDRPYIDPEVLASLKAVCICYGKSNDDPDRAVVKNLVDPDNPFVISNAAYEGMSGYNGYPIILSGTNSTYQDKASYANIVGDDKNIINITRISFNTAAIFSYIKQNGTLTDYNRNIESFKVKVTGIDYSKFVIKYSYISGTNATERTVISITSDGTYELPKSFASDGSLTSDNVWIGLNFTKQSTDIPDIIEDVNVTIEVLPEFEGAFVTDGIDDLITSTKTVQEMLGGSNEITVVSMAHFIKGESNAPEICRINQIRRDTRSIRNSISKIGKSGIFGYTYKNGVTTINNILGDKNDCTAEGNLDGIVAPFSVEGYYYNNNSNPLELCSIAWYWTIIANKVLTTDQINQVIAYFNLDRTLNPDILCNTIKQGITNENHAEFGDKLIDYSGNGRDIQLNNIAWKGDSGIGKYEVDFASLNYNNTTSVFTATYKSCSISKIIKDGVGNIFYNWGQTLATINSTKIQVIGLDEIGAILEFTYLDESGNSTTKQYSTDGIYDLPASAAYQGDSHNTNFRFSIRGYIGDCDITITQIPSHADALCLDGINDFGKVTGMPIYKDYTIIADYERISGIEQAWAEALISKSYIANQGAFVLMETNGMAKHSYSFGAYTTFNKDDSTRTLLYQSKYKCGDVGLNAGTGVDGDTLWLGTYRDNYSSFFNGAIYSLMSFPYSMSEFLIERQLKKHKLGTLYPDMVEFRPIVKSNVPYDNIVFYYKNERIENGTYLATDSLIGMHIRLSSNPANEIKTITVNGVPATFTHHDSNSNIFIYNFYLTSKSPQKINITINEYIRYEDIDLSTAYPFIPLLQGISWGDKLKVGDEVTFIGFKNILPDLYTRTGEMKLNGNNLVTNSSVIIEKSMKFEISKNYTLDNNEPKCILSPRLLRIPNSSYKILGYIPDISGHGNHGKINNSAYAEGSGVNEDGSYQFDGVDDFVTIPTLSSGGKQMLMKVNWKLNAANTGIIYDQRISTVPYPENMIISLSSDSGSLEERLAYMSEGRADITYIDGVLNKNITVVQLQGITHNITQCNDKVTNSNSKSPVIGFLSATSVPSYYAKMSLYDFMLFDNISTDDKIKELNEYVGIEGNTDDLFNETN